MTGSWTEGMDVELERVLGEASKVDEIMKYFRFVGESEGSKRDVARVFAYIASEVFARAPRCPERTVSLRKLLEGREAALRAVSP